MKKTIFSLALFFLSLTALVGCQQELQNVRVKVKHEVIIEGRGDTLRALVVTVLPKVQVVKQPEPTDSLITAPAK